MDPLSLRPATPADAEDIAAIHNEAIASRRATMETEPKTVGGVREWMAGLGSRERLLVAQRDGRVLGWGVLKLYSPRPGYRFTAETSVFLRHTERRQGVGSRLKAALIEEARQLGYRHLLARIMASNVASISYNRRFGYELVGIQREAGFLEGRFEDIAVMQLLLD